MESAMDRAPPYVVGVIVIVFVIIILIILIIQLSLFR